ncbi:MAG: PIN domain-containing protein, partial [Bacteroidota bacterium]
LNEKGRISIYLSDLSINNIYYICRKYLGHKESLKVVEELTEITGTSKAEILQALKNGFEDFEDSIQYSTALTIENVKAIIARNTKDYSKSQIAVFTPENFLKTIENES